MVVVGCNTVATDKGVHRKQCKICWVKCVPLLLTLLLHVIIIKNVWQRLLTTERITPTEKKQQIRLHQWYRVRENLFNNFVLENKSPISANVSFLLPVHPCRRKTTAAGGWRWKTSSCSVAVGRLFKNRTLTISFRWIILHYHNRRISAKNFHKFTSQIPTGD